MKFLQLVRAGKVFLYPIWMFKKLVIITDCKRKKKKNELNVI